MMIKTLVKNFCSVAVLLTSVSCSVISSGQISNNSGSSIVPVVDEKNEKTQRFLWQDWKTFYALSELKRLENETVLRLMLPPNFDKTLALGTRIGSAEESLISWKETLVRDTANYNMNTPEDKVDDFALLADQKKYCDGNFVCDPEVNAKNLLASTLLGKDAFANNNDANYAYLFVKWLTNPKPIGMLPEKDLWKDKDENKLSEEGVKHLMSVYQQMPALTLAQSSLLSMHADRQRFKDFNKGLINEENEGASLLEMISYEVNRRYMSQDWYKQMNQMSEEAIAREMANMKAFELFLRFQEYKRFERIEALLAAQIGVISQMVAQMNQATNISAEVSKDINFESNTTATPQ